jgi:hypothetical protein
MVTSACRRSGVVLGLNGATNWLASMQAHGRFEQSVKRFDGKDEQISALARPVQGTASASW